MCSFQISTLQDLGRDTIVSALKDADWDVDGAMLPLFEKLEKVRAEQRAQQYEEERKAREQKARVAGMGWCGACNHQSANAFLKDLFKAIPEQKIQELLDANDGDVDATTEQLFAYVELEQKDAEERDRRRNVENLVIRFGFSPEETQAVLEGARWNLSDAVKELVKRDTERKIGEFVVLYPVCNREKFHLPFRL